MLPNKTQDLCEKKTSNVHQLKKNKKTLRNIQTNKTDSWKNRKSKQMNYEKGDWINNRKPPSKKSYRPNSFSCKFWASLMVQMVKNLPAIQDTCVLLLGWEDTLEEGMATHSSILVWRIPMDRGAWQTTANGVAKSQIQLERLSTFYHILFKE